MIVRELLTRIGYQVDRRSEDRAKDSFGKLRKAATALGGLLITGVVAQGFRRFINAASDVDETLNVVTVAFDDQAQAVLDWAKVQSDALGRSEFSLREYAASLGQVVGPILDNSDATADLATNLAGLTVDLASFNNESEKDVLAALRSGLLGSSEPLQRFGIDVRDAALSQFALEQGLTKSTKEMDNAEKTALRYRLIMQEAANSQGDAVRTSGGFANQSKRLQGQLLDLAVALGETLLPGANDLLTAFNELVKELSGPLVRAFDVLTNTFRFVGLLLKNTWEAFLEFGTVGRTVLAGLLAATILFLAPWLIMPLAIGAAIAAVVVLVDDLWKGLSTGEGVFAGLLKEFEFWRSETGSGLAALGEVLKTAFNFWAELLTGQEDAWGLFGDFFLDSWQRWSDAVGGFGDRVGLVFREFLDVLDDITTAVSNFITGGIEKLLNLLPRAVTALGDLSGLTGSAEADFPTRITAPGSPAANRNVNASQNIQIDINAPNGNGDEIRGAVVPAIGQAGGEVLRKTQQQLIAGGVTP